jgi:integrase
MPLYKIEEHEIDLPTKERLDMLIANASTKLSLKLSVSKDTGLRPCELIRLKVKNFNYETKRVYPTTAKNGAGRNPKLTENTATRLQEHILRNSLKPEDKIFNGDADHYGDDFREMRNKLAIKLNDPKIHEIRLYDIRHYFCTHTLRKTGNAYVTMKLMGHKKLTTTQKYMHLIEDTNGEWIVEQTNNKERAKQLLTQDYNYIMTTPDGYMTFRKTK